MTGTPPSFAGTPKGPAAAHDVLTEMLRAVRLNGSVFLNACFSEPFGILSPKRYDEAAPLAHLRHISIFHLIAEGTCTVELKSGESRTVTAGDILLLPFADAHRLSNGETSETGFAPDLVRPGPLKGMWGIDYGGGGKQTRMVCGFIESSEFLFAPVFHTLPRILVDRTGEDEVGALLTSTVRQILQFTDKAAAGSELMLGRLMELLFVEVLRRYAAQIAARHRRACSPRSTIRSSAARCNSCMAIRRAAGRSKTSRARQAVPAPYWPSASMPSWVRHRSSMSQAGACRSPRTAFATRARAWQRSQRM